MGASQLAIKSRIRSVDSTMKITKAMQLVAASKYTRQKERMKQNKEYAQNPRFHRATSFSHSF